MYACPSCSQPVTESDLACGRCRGDLRIMAMLHELPDVQFNQALRAAGRGDWATATALLGSVLAVRMTDAEAWLFLGLVWARRGAWGPARECLGMTLMLRPGEPRAKVALAEIQRLAGSAPAPAGG